MAASKVLAVMEQRDGTLRKVSHEVLTAARRLAGADGTVDALVLGEGPVADADGLGAFGADRILTATHPEFRLYNPDGFSATIGSMASGYLAVVFPATTTGRDLSPRVAARLKVSCASDVIELAAEDGGVAVTRPVYAGRVLQRARITSTPAILSVRSNTFPAEELAKAGSVTAVAVPAFAARVTVKEVKAKGEAVLDVSEAGVVVSGGRGLKDPANFKLLEDLAKAFGNAAVGASRAVVDAGWRDHDAQVGQTGKTVSPGLYIAVGISGAVQHLAGMRTAKTIVAINKDKDAPIFKVADYGIVGDLFEVLPRLTEEIKKVRGGQ
ncbi:MAG: electron transfer flavoprotein subunit alpha/FixB family protein [Gemmatimonadales bacterium]|nr:electron transfer flavoprotein subunit alpha/FixB family protein [Gemmatimonadales bacterium]